MEDTLNKAKLNPNLLMLYVPQCRSHVHLLWDYGYRKDWRTRAIFHLFDVGFV